MMVTGLRPMGPGAAADDDGARLVMTESRPDRDPGAPRISPAPGDLEIVRRFVNTLDIESGTDELDSPGGLSGWLAGSGLMAPAGPGKPVRPQDVAVSPAFLQTAVALREALRGVLSSHVPAAGTPDAPARAAAAELNRIAGRLRIRIEVSEDGRVAPEPAGWGPVAALTRILLIAAEADRAGTWSRLKTCSASDCRWAFYDRSPTRNGCWCSMRICGSRAKSRAYRRRSRAVTAP
jgi:predicted RNA-binding Zn ribbon-like protein